HRSCRNTFTVETKFSVHLHRPTKRKRAVSTLAKSGQPAPKRVPAAHNHSFSRLIFGCFLQSQIRRRSADETAPWLPPPFDLEDNIGMSPERYDPVLPKLALKSATLEGSTTTTGGSSRDAPE